LYTNKLSSIPESEGAEMKIIEEHNIGDRTIRLVQGDITERDTDAIVNAANSHLQHGGGVAGAIVRKGGQIIQDESDNIGFTPVGSTALTSAGRLKTKFVIHAVGPRMGEGDEDNKLRNAVLNSLLIASQKGLRSISMPAISSGIFGFPKDRAAKIMFKTIEDFFDTTTASELKIIKLVLFDQSTVDAFLEEWK